MKHAVITGIGLISTLGEGLDEHWEQLNAFTPNADCMAFAPHPMQKLASIEFEKQIPRKESRQMEPWQRIGTYSAGLALEMAGVKGDKDLLSTMHMIVAAGGGERDTAVDGQILEGLKQTNDKGAYLNEKLLTELRPTLFLAQLSNLLAGNISIVHGVVGSSRTFMGEEQSGVDAVRIALNRIQAGQGELFLVGGSFNAERQDVLMHYELASLLHKGDYAALSERKGMILGSVGAFLVIECEEHALKRGAKVYARLDQVISERNRRNDQLEKALITYFNTDLPVISANTGAKQIKEIELNLLKGKTYRSLTSALGHSLEAAFIAAVGVAALCLERGKLFNPLEASEKAHNLDLSKIMVSGLGHWRGEGFATLSKP